MRKTFFYLLMIIIHISIAFSQHDFPNVVDTNKPSQSQEYFLKRIFIYRWQGDPVAGLFIDFDHENITLLTSGIKNRIPMNEIAKLTIENEKKEGGRGAVYGLFLGVLAGNMLFYRNEYQPATYVQKNTDGTGVTFANLGFAALGSLVGLAIGKLAEQPEENFFFTNTDIQRKEELQLFIDYIERKSENRFHLISQTAKVYSRNKDFVDNLMHDAGFPSSSPSYYYYYGGYNQTSDINLLRKIQCTYSIKPKLDIGAAVMWLGEPSTGKSGSSGDRSLVLSQSFDMVAYYAVASYRPLENDLPKSAKWNIGFGLGWADVSYDLKVQYSAGTYPNYTSYSANPKIDRTQLSTIFFTELNFYLYPSFSLGIIGDYVYTTDGRIDPLLPMFPSEKVISFQSTSLGLNMGFHF